MAEPKSYRFKVTAPDGTTADSQIFSWPPPGEPEAGAALDNGAAATSSLIDVAPPKPE